MVHPLDNGILASPDYCILNVQTNTGIANSYFPLEDLRTVFQRALNTWPDAPKHLFDISDNLDQLAQK